MGGCSQYLEAHSYWNGERDVLLLTQLMVHLAQRYRGVVNKNKLQEAFPLYGLVLDSADHVLYTATALVSGADVPTLTAQIQEASPSLLIRTPSGSETAETGRHMSSDITTRSLSIIGLALPFLIRETSSRVELDLGTPRSHEGNAGPMLCFGSTFTLRGAVSLSSQCSFYQICSHFLEAAT
jgi:hypothetical protein